MKTLSIAVLALAAFVCGCRLSLYDLDETIDGQTFEVKSGDRLRIVLEENATTGYMWMAECSDTDIRFEREEIEPERDEHDVPICGAPHKVRFTIRVEAGFDGPAHVKFAYRRPWEKKKPVRQIDVILYHTAEDNAPWK